MKVLNETLLVKGQCISTMQGISTQTLLQPRMRVIRAFLVQRLITWGRAGGSGLLGNGKLKGIRLCSGDTGLGLTCSRWTVIINLTINKCCNLEELNLVL